METLVPAVGIAIFPVALVAAGVGYLASNETASVGAALVLTFVVAAILMLVLRRQRRWGQTTRVSNELLLAILLGTVGAALAIGGLAGLSVTWFALGAAVLAGAWFYGRANA